MGATVWHISTSKDWHTTAMQLLIGIIKVLSCNMYRLEGNLSHLSALHAARASTFTYRSYLRLSKTINTLQHPQPVSSCGDEGARGASRILPSSYLPCIMSNASAA
jgi:hypothetical protein